MELNFNNAIVRLHVPDLTDTEREKRKKEFKKSTDAFMKEVLREKKEKGIECGTDPPLQVVNS